MTDQKGPRHSVPRIESIRIKNLRALCDLERKPLAPLTVLLGASGSVKSTSFSAARALTSPLPPPPAGGGYEDEVCDDAYTASEKGGQHRRELHHLADGACEDDGDGDGHGEPDDAMGPGLFHGQGHLFSSVKKASAIDPSWAVEPGKGIRAMI